MNNGLREMLEQLPTTQLDEMLQAELQKRPPDPEAVKMIMRILEEREEPVEITPEIEAAWKEHQQNAVRPQRRAKNWRGPLLRVASVILILGLLFAVMPQEAGAQSLWDRFLFVTENFIEFFNPSDTNDHRVEYEFKTDHPGLQQVHDAVVEMGVTEPVVPTWLPDGYKLVELKIESNRVKTEMYSVFVNSSLSIVLKIDLNDNVITHNYFKDCTIIKEIEYLGITHNVLQNNERFVAIWNRDNVECSLSTECQEDILYKIIESIYVMGEFSE